MRHFMTLSACGLALAACDTSASVGHDRCVGVATCGAPRALELQTNLTAPEVQRVSALALLTPSSELPIAFDPGRPADLVRDADGQFWTVGCDPTEKVLRLRALGPDGPSASERTEPIPEPAALTSCSAYLPDRERRGAVVLSVTLGQSCEDAQGWQPGCDGQVALPARLARFPRGLGERAEWHSGAYASLLGNSQWLWEDDFAAAWSMDTLDLVRLDATGAITVRQTTLSELYGPLSQIRTSYSSHVLARPAGGLVAMVTVEDVNRPAWTGVLATDAAGETTQVLTTHTGVLGMEGVVDARDRLVTFGTMYSAGDLTIMRTSIEDGTAQGSYKLERDGYFDLNEGHLTADAQGNLYFTLVAGQRDARDNVLCRLPLEAGPECWSLGTESYVEQLFADEDGVFVLYMPEGDDAARRLVRYTL